MNLIPYTFDTENLPTSVGTPLSEGQAQGVHFTLNANINQLIVDKIHLWFAGRDEITLIDEGQTASGLWFVIMEWEEVEIDPLFLRILDHDESVVDYSVYNRDSVYEEV